jgi:hypothetical protein
LVNGMAVSSGNQPGGLGIDFIPKPHRAAVRN